MNGEKISYLEIVLLHRTQSCYDLPSIFSDSLKRRWCYFELIFSWDAIQNHTPFEATARMSLREPTIEMFWHSWLSPIWDHEYSILHERLILASSTLISKVLGLSSWLYLIENNIVASFKTSSWYVIGRELIFFKWKLQIINHYSSDNMKRVYFLCFLIQIITNIFHCSRSLMRVNVFVNKVLKHPVFAWGPLL